MMVSAIGLVALLGWLALKPAPLAPPFSRTLISDSSKQLNVLARPEDMMEYAGSTGSQIYFRTKDATRLFVTDHQLGNGKYIDIGFPSNPKINSLFEIIVDSPRINIFAGNLPGIIRVLPNEKAWVTKFSNALFTRSVLISTNSVALRMFEGVDQIFAKGDLLTGKLVKENGISAKKEDAGLSSDGLLHYDKTKNLLVYVSFYNNQVLYLDTNMNLISKNKTIDNVANGFRAGEIKSKGKITSLEPRRLVNVYSSTCNGLLFTNSRLKSKEETEHIFNEVSVIDVYDIGNGLYIGSFYLPSYKNEKLKTFDVLDGKILVMYKHNIITYTLPALKK